MLRAIIIIGIIIISWACTNSSSKTVATSFDSAVQLPASSKVLIELFTSQGCSSCPAADKLISNIISADTNVVALSFHVDYWDRLGWKDVFSNHDYTVRQQEYVRALHAEGLYTPQVVVQGSYEMVGSNHKRVLDAIDKAKASVSNPSITAVAFVNESKININYNLAVTQQPKQQVVIALIQSKANTSIVRGENAGSQLDGYNVVRSLHIQPVQASGNAQFTLPSDLKTNNAAVVLFTQDQQTRQINAVTKIHL